MKPEFKEEGDWILPKEGDLGNKAKNLLEHRLVLENNLCKVPRSMVIPWQYCAEFKAEQILGWIEEFFPERWSVAARSNAPDEDVGKRDPGRYVSKILPFKELRDDSIRYIDEILASYHKPEAKQIRRQRSIKEKGMGLLVQDCVWLPAEVGCFSEIGSWALLTYNDPDYGMESMNGPSLEKFKVDCNGKIIEKQSFENQREHARRLRRLVDTLPAELEKGWEVEFMVNDQGFYVVQLTPIFKSTPFLLEINEKNIFKTREVIGTGKIETDGIIYVGDDKALNVDLLRFNEKHSGYCVVTTRDWINSANPEGNILRYLSNASVVMNVSGSEIGSRPFSAHVSQWMREGRIALQGKFTEDFTDSKYELTFYSPTKLLTQADETSMRANVEIVGEKKPFIPLLEYLKNHNL